MQTYDGSGYILDIPFNISREDYYTLMNQILNSSNNESYIDESTRAHMIQFTFYSPSAEIFVAVDILVEFIVTGYVNPTYFIITPFMANIFETYSDRLYQACDIFRLLLCVVLGYWIFIKIVSTCEH